MRAILISFSILSIALLSGCISALNEYDPSMPEPPSLQNIREHGKMAERMAIARLLQITVRSDEWNKTFSAELYHRNDSTVFFSRGFLGKGAFKGLIRNDSLTILFLSEKQFYEGDASGFTEPDLSEYRYVIERVLSVLSGELLLETGHSGDMWHQRLYLGGDRIKLAAFESRAHSIAITADLKSHSEEFPFYKVTEIEISNSETGARIRANVVEEKIGRTLNLGQAFELPDYSNWRRIDYVELR